MIQSPCRNCPNRHMDKNICALTCKLLGRIQAAEAARFEPQAYQALDAADENRYQVLASFEYQPPSLVSGLL